MKFIRFTVIMNFVLTNIEVFVVIVLLNKPKGTNTENYLRKFKAARTSFAKLECANLKLNENEYTTRILIQLRYTKHGFETYNHIFMIRYPRKQAQLL